MELGYSRLHTVLLMMGIKSLQNMYSSTNEQLLDLAEVTNYLFILSKCLCIKVKKQQESKNFGCLYELKKEQ